MKTLRTTRLRLEPLEESHAGALFDGLKEEELYEFISESPPKDVGALRERYQRWASRRSPDGRQAWLNWALWSPPLDRYVGWVQATVHRDRTADVAYVLFRAAWGHGYAREAVAALIDHLREDWNARRFRASVDRRNRRSIALLEALGFTRGAERAAAPSDELEYVLFLE